MKKYLLAFGLLLIPLGLFAYAPRVTYSEPWSATIKFYSKQSAELDEIVMPHGFCYILQYKDSVEHFCIPKNDKNN